MENNNLYYALLEAHGKAATANMNGSLAVAVVTYKASGSLTQALAAACLAQGDLHAPIDKARELLALGREAARDAACMMEYGDKVPGFGNSFYKGGHDPAFDQVEATLRKERPDLCQIIDDINTQHPKLPQPNAAMWTAAAMEALNIPVGMGPALFISMRVQAWARYLLNMDNITKS